MMTLCTTTLSITAVIITILSAMLRITKIPSIITFSIMSLSIMSLSTMTHNIMTLSIITPSFMTQHNDS